MKSSKVIVTHNFPQLSGRRRERCDWLLAEKSSQKHWATSFVEVNQHRLSGISGTMTIFIRIRPFPYGEEVVKITKGKIHMRGNNCTKLWGFPT